ncbi:MAG TPA: MFS transporter [Saprospiraceae bacterium]|nr:MFS transporter [Saprospiraceae bacterium]HPI06558.1 MFS transporter [Saprospiraceae bacterium]
MQGSAIITRNVWILSLVSLFTDVASEMLYPVMPVYLKSIGFSIVFIGVLEGFAEATAGLSKGYFGNLSDTLGRRLPFVQIGYALSAVSKPMMAVFVYPLWVFFARATDRLGKGIRTGARDALLSDEATPETKGRVFGFHRAMDTTGAVIGPLLALVYLQWHPGAYQILFLIAFLPGILAIAFTTLIREKRKARREGAPKPGFLDFLRYWRRSPAQYRQLAGALLVFTLFNSSDVFLLLKIKDAGLSDTAVIGVYIFYNLVYALSSYPFGVLADRLGMKRVFVSGLFLFAIVYAGMAFATTLPAFLSLFFLYGLYAAATEGVAKAWITNICDHKDTATAIGTFTAFQSIGSLGASSLAGFIWYSTGAGTAFALSAAIAAMVAMYLVRFFMDTSR